MNNRIKLSYIDSADSVWWRVQVVRLDCSETEKSLISQVNILKLPVWASGTESDCFVITYLEEIQTFEV